MIERTSFFLINPHVENKKTFNQSSVRGTRGNLPSSSEATWHYELFATLLLGSENTQWNATLPAVSTGSRLQANLRRHLLLGCLCRSTCSVLSGTICRKHVETAISAGVQSILNPYRSTLTHTTTSQIYANLNSDNIQQRQINTRRQQENLQPFISARHHLKSAFFKWSHLAPRTFCHAAAGIRGQLRRSKTSMGEELKHAISSIASESKSRATAILRRLGPASATLSPAAISSVAVEGVRHLALSALSWSLWSSSFGMPRASHSFGQAPSGTFCHAPVGICEHIVKSKFSSCVDWLKASSKSAAPSAPWVSLSKHLQCFVRNNLSKACWDSDKCRCTIYLKPMQVNSDSYDNFTNLYKSELGQHPPETNKYT